MAAPSDSPSPDASGASRPRSGPVDVPVAQVVAARAGDPGAFARLLEHWDPHLRPFVHHTLAADGSTDRVLAAAYLRAYRALPTYRGERTPGLWLHRVAYLAAVDEIRRLSRDPLRRRPRPDRTADVDPVPDEAPGVETPAVEALPWATTDHPHDVVATAAATAATDEPAAATEQPVLDGTVLGTLRSLAPDQRAIVVMVDVEGFSVAAVADAFDTDAEVVTARLDAARRLLATVAPPPEGPVDALPADDVLDEPSWARDQVVPPVRAAIASLDVPGPSPRFWPDLGRRLLAEREQPASPTLDPVARLARSHPAEAGFKPTDSPNVSVTTMADRAGWTRPRRRWGRVVLVVAALVVVAGIVAAALVYGTRERTPDGTIPGRELAASVAGALAPTANLTVAVDATGPDDGGPVPYRVVLAPDGSWSVSRQDTLDLDTYDATTGTARHIALAAATGGDPTVTVVDRTGLATGAPDTTGLERPAVIDDLAAVGPLLRADADLRAAASNVGDTPTRTARRTLPTGPDGTDEQWRVVIGRADGFPVEIERRAGDAIVSRLTFTDWAPATDVPADTFAPPTPEGLTPTVAGADGYTTTELPAVAMLGRGEAVTPAWLPAGFELAAVAVRAEAPLGADTSGGGVNPPDVSVMSLAYQRGPERIVVTTRAIGGQVDAWEDPFTDGVGEPSARTLGDGRFNGTAVSIDQDGAGRARLWGVGADTVVTVGGDLTPAEAYRVAASLR